MYGAVFHCEVLDLRTVYRLHTVIWLTTSYVEMLLNSLFLWKRGIFVYLCYSVDICTVGGTNISKHLPSVHVFFIVIHVQLLLVCYEILPPCF